MTDFVYEDSFDPQVNIKVVGVGGGGGNALDCMVQADVKNIEYIAVNTDAKALLNSKAPTRIQIGAKLTKGRGAGNRPEVGRQSAEENRDEISNALKGADMIFITAGMGGGTGTGAAPVVAQIAQELGILTVAVVTKPFAFEREQKMAQAERGIETLKKYVDSLVIIPNERLLVGVDKPLTMRQSFAMADDILKTGVKSISDLIVEDGYINLDFADVSTIMKGAGYAHMAIGHGAGKSKAEEAANAVISSPLLETSINGAKRLLINIAMSEDVLSAEVDAATQKITETAAPGVEVILGTAFKEDMSDEMIITVIAAGYDEDDSNAIDDVPLPAENKTGRGKEPIPVKNPLVDGFVPVEPRKPQQQRPSAAIPRLDDDDDLSEIFKILDKK
ncbi:MAG: cell division protein FtsZ [Oscillospiraceae bacterium]|nr:cell division protein FtsZ [Oscillospiraceae bacterium]